MRGPLKVLGPVAFTVAVFAACFSERPLPAAADANGICTILPSPVPSAPPGGGPIVPGCGTDHNLQVDVVSGGGGGTITAVYPSATPSLSPGQTSNLQLNQTGQLVTAPVSIIAPSPLPVAPAASASPFPVTAATPLPVQQNKRTIVLTSTPLTASGVFTSAWFDTLTDGSQSISFQTYATGTGGSLPQLQLQESDDTTNTNLVTSASALFSLNFYGTLNGSINHRYWRAVYTNGNTAQTAFELTATLTNAPAGVALYDPSSGYVGSINNPNSDSVSAAGQQALAVQNFNMLYNNTSGNWGRWYGDPFASGGAFTTDGGSATTSIAAATTGPTVIKASAGRLAHIRITTAGSTGNETFYNNASACSGTILAVAPGASNAATVGQLGTDIDVQAYGSSGITACGGTGSPAVSVSYY